MLLLCRSLRLSVHLSSPRAPARPPWPLGRYAKGKRKMREGREEAKTLETSRGTLPLTCDCIQDSRGESAIWPYAVTVQEIISSGLIIFSHFNILVTLHIHDSGSGDLPSLMYLLQGLSNSLSRWLDLNFRYTAWPEDVLQQTFMETFCPWHYRSASETRPKSREMA